MTIPLAGARGNALPRGVLTLVGLAAATISVAGLRSAAGILAPIFLALVLTIAVHPLRARLQALGVPRWVGTLVVTVSVYILLAVLAVSLVVAAARFAALLPAYESQFRSLLTSVRRWLTDVGVGDQQLQVMLSSFDLGRVADVVTTVLSSLINLLSNAVFVVLLLLFMAADAAAVPDLLDRGRRDHSHTVRALVSFAAGTRRYLVVSTAFGIVVAVGDALALWALGIPLPALWGLLAFITNYLPNIGFILGLIPPAALGLLVGGVPLLIWVIVAYSVLNVLVQSVIQPRVMGDAVGLSATFTFLSLVFWAWVFGALGALLAVPLTLLTKALLVDTDPNADWLRALLTGGRREAA